MADTQPSILVVDDRQENLYAMRAILRKLDAEVVCVTSGEEALKVSLEMDFCLAIVDVQMPEMDGYELVDLIRSNTGTSALPVIFVSAIFSDEYHYRKGYDAGAVDFLSKPVNTDILLSKTKVFIQLWQQKNELQNLISSLQDWNNYLEKTVRERTDALKMENAALASQVKLQNELHTTAAGELDAALAALHPSITRLKSAARSYPNVQEPLHNILASENQARETLTGMQDSLAIVTALNSISRKPVFLHEIVALACNDCQALLDERNITILAENLPALPPVQADPALVRLLLRQLILHALHNAQEGGEVVITGERLPAGAGREMDGQDTRVDIAFQGPGIDRDYQQWVAEILQQPELSPESGRENPPSYRGSSLGLILARKIVDAHGGRLWMEAYNIQERGLGRAVFHVLLG